MKPAEFTIEGADPSWFPRVLNVLARDYPAINDNSWSKAIRENADEIRQEPDPAKRARRLTAQARQAAAERDQLRALVWEMLNTMPPSTRAFQFALRAGELGVTGPDGVPLVPACMPDVDQADSNPLPEDIPPDTDPVCKLCKMPAEFRDGEWKHANAADEVFCATVMRGTERSQ